MTEGKRTPAKKAAPVKKAAPLKAAPVKKAAPAKRAPRKATPAAATTPEPAPIQASAPEPTITSPAEPTPAETARAETARAETARAETTLAETAPLATAPAETAAAETTPPETTPAETTPAKTTPPPGETAPTEVTTAAPESDRTDPWAKLIADPGHAPEFLALAAVQTLGPRARDWTTRTRDAYPTADTRAIARLAKQRFTRIGSLAGLFGALAGSYAPMTLLGTAAIAHAELVLHLAAVYGLDPAAPERAVDLLVITRVHPTSDDAERALAEAKTPAYEEGGLSDAAWRLGRMVAAQTGGWTLLRLASRYFPGASLLTAVLAGNASAQAVAARAEAYYRGKL